MGVGCVTTLYEKDTKSNRNEYGKIRNESGKMRKDTKLYEKHMKKAD